MTNHSPFDWTIIDEKTWPPRRRPSAPFSPTQLEILLSCPLRLSFETSREQGYEPRLETAARIGVAYHATIETLRRRRAELVGSMKDVAAFALSLLQEELVTQQVLQSTRPREATLEYDEKRVALTRGAIIDAAHRLSDEALNPLATLSSTSSTSVDASMLDLAKLLREVRTLLEVPIVSRDGMFKGRADRVEATPSGVRIVDYKSALQHDVAERYVRQIQFYAWLWHDKTGEWPSSGLLEFPLKSQVHSLVIDPQECRAVVDDYRARIAQLHSSTAYALALPGEVCEVCQFRPWCKPFWNSQSERLRGPNFITKGTLGFEGKILSVKRQLERLRVEIASGTSTITVMAEATRFSHINAETMGRTVRALDFHLTGVPSSPRAIANDRSEIFIVDQY